MYDVTPCPTRLEVPEPSTHTHMDVSRPPNLVRGPGPTMYVHDQRRRHRKSRVISDHSDPRVLSSYDVDEPKTPQIPCSYPDRNPGTYDIRSWSPPPVLCLRSPVLFNDVDTTHLVGTGVQRTTTYPYGRHRPSYLVRGPEVYWTHPYPSSPLHVLFREESRVLLYTYPGIGSGNFRERPHTVVTRTLPVPTRRTVTRIRPPRVRDPLYVKQSEKRVPSERPHEMVYKGPHIP